MIVPVSEFPLPPFTPSSRYTLGPAGVMVLRRVELVALQEELSAGRLEPAAVLTPAEQATFTGFTFPKRRLEWLGGRLAAKAAALALTGEALTAAALVGWQVRSAPDGRPGLERVGGSPGGESVELSISHSHGLAAALVVAEHPCGLDLQKVSDTVVRVRERFCSAEEGALLRGSGAGEEREEVRLTLLWAAKEALRKGRGGVPLTGFLAMRLVGVERIGAQAWGVRMAVAGAGEYPLLLFLTGEYAGAVWVR